MGTTAALKRGEWRRVVWLMFDHICLLLVQMISQLYDLLLCLLFMLFFPFRSIH